MDYDQQRQRMVEEQLKERDIYDVRVLEVMGRVPRHEFVPQPVRDRAYSDRPLSIGWDQTISQPYIVGVMLQLLQLSGHEMILEIGTGSGYQTALLCELAAYVYTMDVNTQLAQQAAQTLQHLGYENLDIHVGDGSQGLPDMGPYDAIIVSASAPAIPGPLKMQLHPMNGRLVLPVGQRNQQYLQLVKRDLDQWVVDQILPVRFVPLIGRYGFKQ